MITSQLVEAHQRCPRQAFFLLRGSPTPLGARPLPLVGAGTSTSFRFGRPLPLDGTAALFADLARMFSSLLWTLHTHHTHHTSFSDPRNEKTSRTFPEVVVRDGGLIGHHQPRHAASADDIRENPAGPSYDCRSGS